MEGFNEVEPAQMVVVKKMVGTYVRKITDAGLNPDKVTIKKDGEKITAIVVSGDKEITGEDSNANIFFSLDRAISKVFEQVGN